MNHRLHVGHAAAHALLLTLHTVALASAHAGDDHGHGSSVESPWLVVAGVTVLVLLVLSLVRRHDPALEEAGDMDDAADH